jgi:2',3'-cyclic-nucleotide 2'-phosphodiesterase (5'-nucleotidase family)
MSISIKQASFAGLGILLFLLVSSCSKEVYLSQVSYDRILISDSLEADSAVWAIISPYKNSLDSQMSYELAELENTLIKQQPEGSLGNFMADAMLETANSMVEDSVDFALLNYGGIRIPMLMKGPVTKGDLFELMPFENELVVLDMDGEATAEMFDRMAAAGGWPVSGATYEIKDGHAINIRIGNRPFNITETYRLAVSDYLANGGDQCNFLTVLPRETLAIKIRDLLIGYVAAFGEAGMPISLPKEGRVQNAE